MPNWERTPPRSGMPIEEMKRRVEAGLKRRRELGQLRPEGLKPLATVPDGPVLTKKQKRVLFQAADLAIASLAQGDATDYCHAVDAINAVRRQAGLPTTFMQTILESVAAVAAELREEPFAIVDQIARHWLADHMRPSDRVISLPTRAKGETNGQAEEDRTVTPPSEGDEPEL